MPESGRTPGNAAEPEPLTEYVKDFLARTGMSERALADRSKDPITEQGLRHGWINELVRGRLDQAPKQFRLRALAAGMGASEKMIAEMAAVQWLGVQVAELPEGKDGIVTVTMPPEAPVAERERFRRTIEAVAEQFWT